MMSVPPELRVHARTFRLLVFGDSWAKSADGEPTWAEIVGATLGWETLNAAENGAVSTDLEDQLDRLLARLRENGETVHNDAWAIVHIGGNELLCDMDQVIGALLGHCGTSVLNLINERILALLLRLERSLGVRNVILVGIPLTRHLPLVAHLPKMYESVLKAYVEEHVGCFSCLVGCMPWIVDGLLHLLNSKHMGLLRQTCVAFSLRF